MYQKIINKFNNISFIIIAVLCAIIPLIFLPATIGGGGIVKGFILYVGVFIAVSIWLIAQFISGSFKVPKSAMFLGLGSWVVLSLISALTSINPAVSLWGRGFVFDSFSTTLVLSLFIFLITIFSRDQIKLVKLFLFTFVGSALTVFLQFILYISQNVPFVSKYLGHVANQGTLVGSWVDFTYFATFVFILALLMYEVLIPKGFFKVLSFITMIVSLITLVFLNFKTAWIVAIVASLVVFVYKSSVERTLNSRLSKISPDVPDNNVVAEEQKFPLMSLISLLIGLFFFLSNASIGSAISQSAGISFNDIRPSFKTTTQVMRSSLYHDPLFGAGAGRYGDAWNLYRPDTINNTIFWNSPFETGFNLVQSLVSTNGLLPVLALVFVLIFSLIHGFKLFNSQFPDRFTRFIAVTSLIMILAFVMLFIFTSPGLVLIIFGFTYIGLLFGVSSIIGKTKVLNIDYLKDPRTSFFAILLLVVASMAGFSSVYFTGNKFASIVLYNRAINATDFVSAERYLNKAILLSNSDIYWRSKAALYTSEFRNTISKENPDSTLLQNLFSQAEQSAQAAVALANSNSLNWINLSQIYQLIANSDSTEAIDSAMTASLEAQKLSPKNPFIRLNNAQINLIKKDNSAALVEIEQALSLKPNYLEAFILRGRIQQANGDSQALKNNLLMYISIAPYDEQGYIVLSDVYNALKEYALAVDALAKAKALGPNNANTHLLYINALELSGNKTKALEELEIFKKKFPKIEGVDEQIKRLQNNTNVPSAPTEVEKNN